MLRGRSPGGPALYPAFPYTSYTRMSDDGPGGSEGLSRHRAPVDPAVAAARARFPFDQRWGLYLWQWAFFKPARFEPDPARDAAWNRGAYLVEGPGHCQECHTPRNLRGALDDGRAYAGGPAPSRAREDPNITATRKSASANGASAT